jgi:hypothetical protein
MVVSDKKLGHIMQELKDMLMDVCNGAASDQAGKLLPEYFNALCDISPTVWWRRKSPAVTT